MGKSKPLQIASGAAAAEEIGRGIQDLRDARRETAKMQLVFLEAYEKLWSKTLIQSDPTARALMFRIAAARNVGQLERQVAALARRVTDLGKRHGAAKRGGGRARSAECERRRIESLRGSHGEPASGRTFIRL